jgi:CMP-N,N'-diacetyllegionaminic acid synthase
MINSNRGVLALITARGGSKGLPRKNVLPVAGRPLIAWTISAALESSFVDRVVLSSDDDEIIDIAKSLGCEIPFRRPKELSTDQASSIDVVLHAISMIHGYRYLVLLQPTSPMRSAEDIDMAMKLMLECGANSCASVCRVEESPYWMYRVNTEGRLQSLLPTDTSVSRRQDLPEIYVLNGAIYIASIDQLLKQKNFVNNDTLAYVMPKERSIDIDDASDFEAFRKLIELDIS